MHSRTFLIRATQSERQYQIVVDAETGPQYRLGELVFRNASVAKQDELRALIPLKRGDLFNVVKIREGLEEIGRFYGRLGYIDATPEPETFMDEEHQVIAIVILLDEGIQYRTGKIEILGLDPQSQTHLQSRLKVGDVFNKATFEESLEEVKPSWPDSASPDRFATINRNMTQATVEIILDFRPCHPI